MVCVVKHATTPLQGGLPPIHGAGAAMLEAPIHGAGAAMLEIACDESGFSGSNLLDAATPIFTHASVDLAVDEAIALITALRSGFACSVNEFKSGQFLRSRQSAEALEWLLAALSGRAHVLAVDKEYFLVTRIVDLFLTEPSYAAGTRLTQDQRPAALALYRGGRSRSAQWRDFLAAFVELARAKRGHRPDHSAAERLLRARDSLARVGLGPEAAGVLDALDHTRVLDVLNRLALDDRSIPPMLEPMLPALAETVLFWSGGRRQVLVIHDEQSALTAGRLRMLQQVLTGAADASAARAPVSGSPTTRVSPLAGLVTVDSRGDPRVQIADLLAGVTRRSPDLGGPLRSFLSPTSLLDPGLKRSITP
jgi:hypothetical protein